MRLLGPAFVVAGVLLLTSPALSHHSQAEYEDSKQVTVKGKVSKFAWMNPHVWVFVDVPDAQGKIVNWGIEANAAASMSRAGWKRTQYAAGEEVTVVAWPRRDGTTKGLLNKITRANGDTFTLAGNGPAKPR